MNSVSHASASNHQKDDTSAPSWLVEKVYQRKRQRTIELVKHAVDALGQEGERVSLATVSRRTKDLDPEGLGVSEGGILGNEEARAYYQRHRSWNQPRPKRFTASSKKTHPLPGSTTLTRDEENARRRYLRLSKAELVEQLLAIEHSYAEQEQRWLSHQDDLLTWQLRAQTAEARLQVFQKAKT